MKTAFATRIYHLGRYSCRGYIPHIDHSTFQFISYRLNDSLPSAVLAELDRELSRVPSHERDSYLYRRIEHLLDNGYGSCVLARDDVAEIVYDTWQFHDGKTYRLVDWIIMPNHVHVLIEMYPNSEMSKILHSWRSFTSKQILEIDSDPFPDGRVWQRGYYDRYIRDEAHFNAVVSYIRQNAVKAGLVEDMNDWFWSSKGDG